MVIQNNFTGVIRVLWPELAGDTHEGMTEISDGRFSNERITLLTSDRPISTYGNQGSAKPGLKKHEHAIIWSGGTEPLPGRDERPSRYERPMGRSIKVAHTNPRDYPMLPKSRINFGKMYTIEHNIKVLDFGQVCKECEWSLKLQWHDVLFPPNPAWTTPSGASSYPDTTAADPSNRTYTAEYSAMPGPSHDYASYLSPIEFAAEVDAGESGSSRVEEVNAEPGAVDDTASRADRTERRSRRHGKKKARD
ncbi:hypothetical protein LTR66_008305 [Elasticomyces elasticus]|nr:hypothetical protein LTR66_008305 [Elasticomyces elasticus]